ncbi:MAG TPA: M20/M25/M40 family metallo-hydrolase, partial [Pyrinomonadaceae bacterium]|nr:M20/M25/M40 family metallo-hydrolase [Pyrinomonadaceae bacterium]
MNKLFHRICLYSILSITVSIAVLAQQPAQPSTDRLRSHVKYLASDELEGRRTGTPGAQRAAQYIAEEFKRLGLRPAMKKAGATNEKGKSGYLQPFPYVPRELAKENVHGVHGVAPVHPAVEARSSTNSSPLTAWNVVGILEGSDPLLKNEAIIIGAHYDHLGRGGSGSLAQREGGIHHGADDNASGVAGIIELARTLTTQRPKPRRTIVFIAFSGEEEGLLGSDYYVNHPVVPIASTV